MHQSAVSQFLKLLIFVATTFVSDTSSFADNIFDKKSFYGSYSTDRTTISVVSYGTAFEIPRYYLESVLISIHDNSTSFAAIASFPEFLGVTNANDGGIVIDQNVIAPTTKPNLIRLVSSELIYSREHDPNSIVFDAESGVPDTEWRFGLSFSSKRTSNKNNTVYFSRPRGDDAGFVAFCDTENNECNSYLRFSSQLVIICQYNVTLLKDWKGVRDGTSALIGSWVFRTPR